MMFTKISKSQIKTIRLLQLKKYRQKYNQFIVEGLKSVNEFVNSSLKCHGVFGDQGILDELCSEIDPELCYKTTSKELVQISALKSTQNVLAIFEIPQSGSVDIQSDLILALDDIRDPGNLGTIIRTADWFGLKEVVCSRTSVDCYNAKVIQASMGSLSRIKVHYLDLASFIESTSSHELLIADMHGVNYKQMDWNKNILLIGNEGKGVSEELRKLDNRQISIPRIGKAESLNAAISTSILLAERLSITQ